MKLVSYFDQNRKPVRKYSDADMVIISELDTGSRQTINILDHDNRPVQLPEILPENDITLIEEFIPDDDDDE